MKKDVISTGTPLPTSYGTAPAVAPMQLPSTAAVAREVATIQSQMSIAQMFPRDINRVQQRIISACSRPQLANSAVYVFAKGGSTVQGASIRLAEALLTAYGNAKAGFEIMSQTDTESTVRAYALDMETNTLVERSFIVSHLRYTKKGSYVLTDPREIYETVASQASRKLRACILEIIPNDLQELAMTECNKTLAKNVEITPEKLENLVVCFGTFGVTKAQIETLIQRKLEAITQTQYLDLKRKYVSLRDGVASPEDFFGTPSEAPVAEVQEGTEEPVNF